MILTHKKGFFFVLHLSLHYLSPILPTKCKALIHVCALSHIASYKIYTKLEKRKRRQSWNMLKLFL